MNKTKMIYGFFFSSMLVMCFFPPHSGFSVLLENGVLVFAIVLQ